MAVGAPQQSPHFCAAKSQAGDVEDLKKQVWTLNRIDAEEVDQTWSLDVVYSAVLFLYNNVTTHWSTPGDQKAPLELRSPDPVGA